MPSTPFDYGERSPRSRGVQVTTPIIAGGAVLVAAVVAIWVLHDQGLQASATSAEIELNKIVGQPCPAASNGHFTSPLRPTNLFDYNDLTFGHRFGAADCSAIPGKGFLGSGYEDVCQFSSPAVLSVTSGGHTSYYEPGVGREATIIVDGGKPRCVLASPFFARWKQQVTETDAAGKPTFGAKATAP